MELLNITLHAKKKQRKSRQELLEMKLTCFVMLISYANPARGSHLYSTLKIIKQKLDSCFMNGRIHLAGKLVVFSILGGHSIKRNKSKSKLKKCANNKVESNSMF